MLFKLNVSHLFVIPPGAKNEIGSPQLFLDGTTGIDLRLINDEAVIISVKKNSPAFNAGIKAGYSLIKVNDKTTDSIIDKKSPNHSRRLRK